MQPSILMTQCLQNDFVKPIGRYDPLPNLLHVGFEEARRLMGDDPEGGPVARMMRWANEQEDDALRLVHIRDWHSSDDPAQRSHLRQFGDHCLRETEGAGFAFDDRPTGKGVAVVDSLTLNDFVGTSLESILDRLKDAPVRVGLVGVWTEAKITYLAYELATRYPHFEIAVSSALTASSSTAQHFLALDQLQKLLGVRVVASVGEFMEFLTGKRAAVALPPLPSLNPAIEVESATLEDGDQELLRYLFRDCRSARLRCLAGGYSGNVVLGSESQDALGHQQAPHVVKIGPRDLIGRERTAFERIESVLGNNAPRITEFADRGERGAIKYRYASMGGFASTFQKLYQKGLELAEVERILRTVFVDHLGRLYAAATRERVDLLEEYGFSDRWAPSVRRKVEALVGPSSDSPEPIRRGGGAPRHEPEDALSLVKFYEDVLPSLPRDRAGSSYVSYVHGDLNGANIVLDGNRNVWIIDFFHTHRGHVLKDLIKLENDLLYIFTPIESPEDLEDALRLTRALLSVEDLEAPLPGGREVGLERPALLRGYDTLRLLRAFYPAILRGDSDPLQLFIGALRYAAHTLAFHESTLLQKKWALAAGALLSAEVARRLRERRTPTADSPRR